jgi:hypothetical protein
MSNPSDLNIVTQPDTDKNYFNFKAAGLKIDTNYAIKFQWVYEDGTVSEWSAGKFINTVTENVPAAVTATVPATAVGNIPVTLSTFPANTKRVDVYIIGGVYGTGKVADSFFQAGTKNISVTAGEYQVSLIAVTPSGINGTPTNTFSITVSAVGETIQEPTNPNGFSIDRILGGIQVNWAGTYANGTFTGFEAIKIYVGTSASATSGTYKESGVMTGNNVKNAITVPVDGTYLRYNLPVYVHAAAVNKNGTIGAIQANVANDLLGAKTAVSADLADEIITNAKLVADSVTSTKIAVGAITEVKIDANAITAAKIASGAVTETKIADNAISSPKIVAGAIDAGKIAAGAVTTEKLDALAITADKIAANAITSDKIIANAITAGKIDALAITSDKIAANAITASKILAGEIDVLKLAAGTISVDNLDAGTIKSTSYIRAGSKNLTTGLGARVEISSAAIEDGTVDIAAGFYIYNSSGTAVLSAPLNGGLSIIGGGTFSGNLSAAGGSFTGSLDVGSTTLANITGASSVNVNSVTRVRFIAENALSATDVVTISGIAQNQTFAYWAGPGNTNPVYNYSNNPFNLGTVTVYEAGPTYFDIQSGVTGTYTSGGIAAGTAFKVTSTGIVRAAAGKIGGWTVDVTKLRSASGSISLDPITPQITIQGSGGYTGYDITLAAPTGITAGSTFSVTPAGYLTSTSGSIAGWNVTSSSISKAVSYTDIFGTSGTLTTTLGSNAKITVTSTNAPFGFFNLGIDSAIVTENANQKVEVGPNGLGFVNKTMNLGVQSGYMRMWTNSGDKSFNIYWDGWRTDPTAYTGATPETYAPFQWKWINYSTAAERLTHIASITYDTLPQSLRPLVIDGDGSQYLGATSYFSTTQTTTPSAGTGQNGDLFYSTA